MRHPSGKKLQDEGVTPGVLVGGQPGRGLRQRMTDDAAAATDTATKNAPAAKPVAKPSVTVDDQLNKALEMLKSKAA